MTTGQKVIKGFAISLACFIIIFIISIIVCGLVTFFNIYDYDDNKIESDKNLIIENNYDILSIDIDLSYTNLIIKNGLELKVETNNKDVIIKEDNRVLEIEEEKKHFFKNYEDYELILYIPKDKIFEKIEIDAGAGKIEIETLKCNNLKFKFGAGKATINNLISIKESKIEGGAGSILIANGSLNNLNLDMGIGKFELTSNLTGNIKIDAFIGEVLLHILNKKDNYTFKIDKGIGTIKIDSSNISKEGIYGTGKNYIDIDGGIGKIAIDFKINN